jgi:hypothetical protein
MSGVPIIEFGLQKIKSNFQRKMVKQDLSKIFLIAPQDQTD